MVHHTGGNCPCTVFTWENYRHIILELFLLLTGGQGGCGCLIKSIIGILACILLIWYIITELF